MRFRSSWLENAPLFVTILAAGVSIDLFAGATGKSDPFPFGGDGGFPLMASLRGCVITLSVSYAVSRLRAMWAAPKRNHYAIFGIATLTLLLLVSETAVTAPYILTRMLGLDMATAFWTFSYSEVRVGAFILAVWSLAVASIPTLSVILTAIAMLVREVPAETRAANAQQPQPAPQAAPQAIYRCEDCGAAFQKQTSFAAHKRYCARRTAVATAVVGGNTHGE